MKKGEGETKHCRRITMGVTAAISPNESSWGGSGGCLGFLVYLFSGGNLQGKCSRAPEANSSEGKRQLLSEGMDYPLVQWAEGIW
jgi:hypothetical protein